MKYEILYRTAPAWSADGKPMPDDYAGYVISVKPAGHKWGPGDLRGSRRVVTMELTEEQYKQLASRQLKVSPDGKQLLPVTFEDRWGVMAEEIKKRIPDAEAAETTLTAVSEDALEKREQWTAAVKAAKAALSKLPIAEAKAELEVKEL